MRAHGRRILIAAIVLLTGMTALGLRAQQHPVEFTETDRKRIARHTNLGEPPVDTTNRFAADDQAAAFGHRLFFDTRLSGNGQISCVTCHDPMGGFADGASRAMGIAEGTRNSPSLWNVAYNRWYFWDGRSDSLWNQAMQPIERDVEMDSDRLSVVHLLSGDAALRAQYEAIFGALPDVSDASRFPAEAKPGNGDDPRFNAWNAMADVDQDAVNRVFANVGKAMAAYQTKLISNDAPFDRFARALASGDQAGMDAMSVSAQRGLKMFIGRGNCRICHSGPNFSDGEFHNILVPPLEGGLPRDRGRYDAPKILKKDIFNASGAFSDDRSGVRSRLTRSLISTPEQWGQFKTPSLRNVALSAPYMHEGQYADLREVFEHYSTLEDAIQFGHHAEQLLVPLNLTDEEMGDLEAFLNALTDESIEERWLRPPGVEAGN
ncbi:MAG: cytochrome c peroxidase [Planctomycetota bacterium]